MHKRSVAIVGAAETTELGKIPDLSVLGLHADAARNALADAQLTVADIDGFATSVPYASDVADALGVRPRWIDGTMVGGCGAMLHVRHAAAAIAAGAADVVLITHAESGRSRVGSRPVVPDPSSMAGQFEHPFGAFAPYNTFTLSAMKFLSERGMTQRDLAEVVVAQRNWASRNPRAARRALTNVDEVINGPIIAYPFTRDMCCVVTDGGGALVLTSAERAKDTGAAGRAIYIAGSGEASDTAVISQMQDLGSAGAFRRASDEAFRTAGVSRAEIDHAMFYDAFAHVPLYMLEDCGFVGHGESGGFIADGNTEVGGLLPSNTNGGGLSYTHTGMYSMFAVLESIRQLRGVAAAQVAGISTSLVQGVGFYFAAAATLILTNEA